MGGRGGAGGSSNASGGLKLPTMTGTEKQVSWAEDVLKSPYETMRARAENLKKSAAAFDKASSNGAGGARERKEAEAYQAAGKRYAAEISKLHNMAASAIIDKRAAIKNIATNILKDEYKKRGFAAYEAGRL